MGIRRTNRALWQPHKELWISQENTFTGNGHHCDIIHDDVTDDDVIIAMMTSSSL